MGGEFRWGERKVVILSLFGDGHITEITIKIIHTFLLLLLLLFFFSSSSSFSSSSFFFSPPSSTSPPPPPSSFSFSSSSSPPPPPPPLGVRTLYEFWSAEHFSSRFLYPQRSYTNSESTFPDALSHTSQSSFFIHLTYISTV